MTSDRQQICLYHTPRIMDASRLTGILTSSMAHLMLADSLLVPDKSTSFSVSSHIGVTLKTDSQYWQSVTADYTSCFFICVFSSRTMADDGISAAWHLLEITGIVQSVLCALFGALCVI